MTQALFPNKSLIARNVTQAYPTRNRLFRKPDMFTAVDNISLTVDEGETLGIVGESGSGKSTLGRILAGIELPASGNITFFGQPYAKYGSVEWRRQRRDVQVVYQNPASVLDPRWSIHSQVREALITHEKLGRGETSERVQYMLDLVGLGQIGTRLPHQLSGGQLQRAVIARALVLNPKLIICDEAVSALDVSVQAQIINLLIRLRETLKISMVFISHDLSVVQHISHRIGVMYRGSMLEIGTPEALFANPTHEYSRKLLSAIPIQSPRQRSDYHTSVKPQLTAA